MPFRLGTTELVILLVIVLLLFGVGRIGRIASELGRGIRARQDEFFVGIFLRDQARAGCPAVVPGGVPEYRISRFVCRLFRNHQPAADPVRRGKDVLQHPADCRAGAHSFPVDCRVDNQRYDHDGHVLPSRGVPVAVPLGVRLGAQELHPDARPELPVLRLIGDSIVRPPKKIGRLSDVAGAFQEPRQAPDARLDLGARISFDAHRQRQPLRRQSPAHQHAAAVAVGARPRREAQQHVRCRRRVIQRQRILA